MAVTHLALLEPTDDPRPFYYMWVVFQDESISKAPPVLRMYAMLFERKYCDHGTNLYFNLEANPSLKFEFELSEGDRVVGLCTVERESNPEQTESGIKRGEDNLLLIATNERTLLFDLNQWYKEQMPGSICECQNPNSILATYRTMRSDHLSQLADGQVISFAYVPLSLQEFPSNGPSSPEELFYPNSLSLEWAELSPTKLTFWMTRGVQADLLREMAMAGPIILIQPSETFHRCLSVGLVPFNSEVSFASDQNAQREMLLSLCLEQRWSTFLVKCAVEWSDGSASYLYPTFLKWGVQRASAIKMLADRLCIPLFDQSGGGIGEVDVKTLRFCSQQLECLSNVVAKLPSATADLTKQQRTLKRVFTYFQVLLWFYDVGLLPETQELEEEGALPISLALKVPYPYERLSALYKEKRAQARQNKKDGDKNEEELFIDEFITRECPLLKGQWEREGNTTITDGYYPPPSLQSLLRSYLTDCQQMESNEISCKHQITIYLLMDLAMLLQRLYPGVDQLIKYPSAFKMSPSLIKLTQAFWLLDHEDYQGFLDMMTGQLVSDSDVKDWHHKLILRTLVRNNQHRLALVYLRVRKPPLSSMEEQGVAVSLSVEHGLVQSAFHRRPPCHYEQLLTCFFRACKTYGKLNDILHLALDSEEEEVFVKFLEENKTEDLRLLYYLQRCRYTEAIAGSGCHPTFERYHSSFAKDMQSASTLGMLSAYNMTLPDITKRFSMNAAAINSDVDLDARYPRPMSHCKSHDKLRGIHETVITKARETYLRGEKCQIPFVSAPCTSLKLNNHSTNVNCVLFPALVHKTVRCGKRTVDQIYRGESDVFNGTNDDTPDAAKRRKLSDGQVSPNKSSGAKELGLNFATFETPLVKRKFNNASTNKDVTETPQSILKIRHLIRSSVSPGVAASPQTKKEITDKLSSGEREKKLNRQIRFNINQPKKTLIYEDENEEKAENKEEQREEEIEDENDNKINMSSESEDVFLSPEASIKSYTESAVLSSDSSNSSRSYCYPRPRPSLRRSALQSSVELLQKSHASAGQADDNTSLRLSAVTLSTSIDTQSANVSRRRSSLLSASVYSTTLLSPNSSVEISGCSSRNSEHVSPQSRWRFTIERGHRNKLAISSTPLTKSIISKTRVNDGRMKIDNEEQEEEIAESNEESDVINVSGGSLNLMQSSYDRGDLVQRQDSFERNVQGENQQSDSKYNNGGIARRDIPSLRGSYEEHPALSEYEKIAELNLTISDESDEELLRLRHEDEDEGHEETFESLSTILDEAQMQSGNEIPITCSLQTQSLKCRMEGHGVDTKSNGLRELVRVEGDIDFIDNESASSRDATSMFVPDESDNNEKEGLHMPTIQSDNVLYDLSNITDDESDGDIKQTEEESKAKNGKFPNLPGQYMTNRDVVKTGKNGESDKESMKSDKRQNVSRKSVDGNIESQEKIPSETASSSNHNSFQIESEDSQFMRVTRSRRASSLAKDQVTDTSTSRSVETGRVARLRRANSVTKETTSMDSPSRNLDEPLRLQTSTMFDSSAIDSLSQETNPKKPPRLRRASSATNDVSGSSSIKTRSRRASSLAKDVSTSSITIDEDLGSVTSSKLTDAMTPSVRLVRCRKPISTAKEILQTEVKESNIKILTKNEPPVRRSARLTSSAKKETRMDTSKTPVKLKNKSNLASDEEEDKGIRKRSVRTKRFSISSDKATTTATSRQPATDLDKEMQPKEAKTIRNQSRRGSSVPKEITMQTGRKRRSSSIIKETILEVAEPPPENSRILRSSTVSTRGRSTSIQSIPAELEEILSQSPRETRSAARKEKAHGNTREKRASSVDVLFSETKKRTRSIRTKSSIVEPIAEEPAAENEYIAQSTELQGEDKKEVDNETTWTTPTRRRRAASITTHEGATKNAAKRNKDRTRRASDNQESSNMFSFSQPEKTNIPLDTKGKIKSMHAPSECRSHWIHKIIL